MLVAHQCHNVAQEVSTGLKNKLVGLTVCCCMLLMGDSCVRPIASLLYLISILCIARLEMRLTASASLKTSRYTVYYACIYMIYVATGTRLRNPIALHDRGAVYSYSTVLLVLSTVCCSQRRVLTNPMNPPWLRTWTSINEPVRLFNYRLINLISHLPISLSHLRT